jgi:hypothetical protein
MRGDLLIAAALRPSRRFSPESFIVEPGQTDLKAIPEQPKL